MHRHFLPLIILLFSAGCAPTSRTVSTHTQIHDTLHITVHDTVSITHVRDSIVFHAAERSRTEQTVTYDPSTGHPVMQHTVSEREVDIDALVRHIIDSIDAAHAMIADAVHEHDDAHDQHSGSGEAALTPAQTFARRIATMICICFVISCICLAIRIYIGRHDS